MSVPSQTSSDEDPEMSLTNGVTDTHPNDGDVESVVGVAPSTAIPRNSDRNSDFPAPADDGSLPQTASDDNPDMNPTNAATDTRPTGFTNNDGRGEMAAIASGGEIATDAELPSQQPDGDLASTSDGTPVAPQPIARDGFNPGSSERETPNTLRVPSNVAIFPPFAAIVVAPSLFASLRQIQSAANRSLEFFDLTDGDDSVRIAAGAISSAPGGVRALDGNDTIFGAKETDVINGNRDNDILHGSDGEDYLRGGRNEDWLLGDRGNDLVNGNHGNDIVDGGPDDDIVRGGRGDDLLIGGDGNDILVGDFGTDTLLGGAGADVFVLRQQTESNTNPALADTIADFNPDGDRLLLEGNFSASDLRLISFGEDTIVQTNDSVVLGVVRGISPTELAELNSLAIVPTADDFFDLG